MAIVSEGGRRGDSGSSSFRRRGGGSSSSAAAAAAALVQCEEMDESDGEVQSSFRGPFDTMDALQGALPSNRKGVSKFYNTKSSAAAAHPAQGIAIPGNPSPKKRKGFLSFSFSWSKSRSKGSSSRRDASTSSKNCRNKTTLPASALTSSSHHGNSRGVNEHARRWLQRSSSARGVVVSASPPPASVRSQLIAVQLRSVSVARLEDVAESTASICPREKRRKSLQ
nr:unnamed protein product [Digitaria exilis]